MRLDRASPPSPEDLGPRRRGHPSDGGPTLWTTYYTAWWFHLTMLAALVILPRGAGLEAWPLCMVWSFVFAFILTLGAGARLAIHDLLIALAPREQLALLGLVACFFIAPLFARHATIMHEGFLWATPLLALLAVQPAMARRLLAWTLLGAWFAALGAGDWRGVALAAGFGVSWLAALGATHFAFTGEPYGLGGAWPAARLARNVVVTAIPAALTAAAAFWLWHAVGPRRWSSAGAKPRAPLERFDPEQLMNLVWQCATVCAAVAVVFIVLIYLHRRWQRRMGMVLPEMLPGQAAQLEYEELPARVAQPRLAGRRAQVAALWGRWAAAMDRVGLASPPREPGETAAQFAGRLPRPPDAKPQTLTAILENAHYGPAEPSGEDVARMRELVEDELLRVSLESQMPVEPLPRDEAAP